MTAAEFDLWAAYYRTHGFDADRIEATAARAGAATARAMGSRVRPDQIVARFGRRAEAPDPRRMIAFLESMTPERFFPHVRQ